MRLLDDLRALGFEIEAIGDKVRVRHPAPTPPEAGCLLLEELRRHKAEVLAALTAPSGPPAQPPTALRMSPNDPGSPWPAEIPGLGSRTVGPFASCLWCGAGTWARYGQAPTCLACARKMPDARDPQNAQALLHALLTTWATMDERLWTPDEVAILRDQILGFWTSYPEEAETWWQAWRTARPGAQLA